MIDVVDLVLSDLADLDEMQLIDLAMKLLNLAVAKLEYKEKKNEE